MSERQDSARVAVFTAIAVWTILAIMLRISWCVALNRAATQIECSSRSWRASPPAVFILCRRWELAAAVVSTSVAAFFFL